MLHGPRPNDLNWSGRPDLNRGPPAPKAGVISPGSPSFSISFLKIKELKKYLVVARCTEMWLGMRGVPPISPSVQKQRNASADCSNPSVESRKGAVLPGLKYRLLAVAVSQQCHEDKGWAH